MKFFHIVVICSILTMLKFIKVDGSDSYNNAVNDGKKKDGYDGESNGKEVYRKKRDDLEGKNKDYCQPGYYLNLYKRCRPCPKGFYQNKHSKRYCKRCPKGKTTWTTGTRDKFLCFDPHGKKRLYCQPGYYLNRYKGCRPCPKGFYQNKHSKNYCKRCPKGKTTRTSGTRDKFLCFDYCQPGCYLNRYKGCRPCPKGFYQNIHSKNYCKRCPKGKTTRTSGTRDKFLCFDPHAKKRRWSYDEITGPNYWGEIYKDCKGSYQSPINIPPLCGMEYDENLEDFVFHGFDVKSETNTVKNTGRTVQVDIGGNMTVEGGGLQGPHKVVQFHFHWGPDDTKGAEHLFNGEQFPLELHIVTYNMKYPDFVTALDKYDGLAVLGYWYEIGDEDNSEYVPLLDKLSDIKFYGDSTTISDLIIEKLLPKSQKRFYRYHGSLTTPPCFESVTWTLFEDRLKMSSEQMDRFRSLFEDTDGKRPMLMNYRPTHPLNSRKVYVNYNHEVDFGLESNVCEIPSQ